MMSYAPQTPSPNKRPMSRSRMSHLLRGGSSDSARTPSRHSTNNNTTPESPMLINALKLAARSGSGSNTDSSTTDELSEEGFSPLPQSPSDERSTYSRRSHSHYGSEHSLASSYANSIEAMAATVEAAAINRQRPRRSPKKSPKKRSGGSNSSIASCRHPHYEHMDYKGTKKQLFSSKRKRVIPKLTAGHLVAIVILVPFLIMEAFLSVLVFTYNYNGVSTGVARDNSSAVGMVHLNVDNVVGYQQQVEVIDDEDEELDEGHDDFPSPTIGEAEVGNSEEEEHVDVLKSQIVVMQSMLQNALKKINDGSSSDKIGKKAVEMLCLTVWSRAVEAISSNENDVEDNDSLDTLAVDAQRCLGGIELAFLSRDVNTYSVRKSRVIFESLSDVNPHNAEVRAGLGTSLLILGVMKEDESLLTLAMFHLKAASLLCQKGAVEAESRSIFQSDETAMSAAILHNLALANIALGDDASSVSLLLRAGAIRRENSSHPGNLFWNLSDDALSVIEQQAVLLGAKRASGHKKKKSKIPFLSDRFAVKELSA